MIYLLTVSVGLNLGGIAWVEAVGKVCWLLPSSHGVVGSSP